MISNAVVTANESGIPLEEFQKLADANFAQLWKERFQLARVQMLPEIGRWLNIVRYFHPRKVEDHWHDRWGNPSPKLYESEGLSVEIYNLCRPIIEVYGSLLAGQKPLPFAIDVLASDAKLRSEVFRADAQEKLLMHEMLNMKIPLPFMDFCVSTVMFGIGYVWSWIDPQSLRLRTQAISWPGDVLPQWGSDRYGRGGDALESVIFTERMQLDTARRLYPDVRFVSSSPDIIVRPDMHQTILPPGTTQILKTWWRWWDPEDEDEKVGYAEVAYDGTESGDPETLMRQDDSGYPDIPVRWATRFQTPGEAPHRSAGVLDDVVGVNTEYEERLSALADLIVKVVFPKFKGKGFNINNIPQLRRDQNVIPMTDRQDLLLLQEVIAGSAALFDSFLGRVENFIFSSVGLSKLFFGSAIPGETSGEALNTLLHASISRLEVVRTPIQWAWISLIEDIWVPLLYKYGSYSVPDPLTGKKRRVTLQPIFDQFFGLTWTWPDVTPRDALRAIQVAMDLANNKMLSKESAMGRAQIPSVVDEMEKIRRELLDPVVNPEHYRLVKLAEMMTAPQQTVTSPGAEKMAAQIGDENLKARAAGQPPQFEEDNKPLRTRRGSAANAAQGLRSIQGGGGPVTMGQNISGQVV